MRKDAQVIVHRTDGPQQGRLHMLSEERIHSRGAVRDGEIRGVHGAAGCKAGAGTSPEFSRAVTGKSTAEIAAAVA